jgi:hypothetical protein
MLEGVREFQNSRCVYLLEYSERTGTAGKRLVRNLG